MPVPRSPKEIDRYIRDNLDPSKGLREGLPARQFLKKTADVSVISYPKSGKTWLSYMATSYIADYLGCAPSAARHIVNKGFLRTLSPEAQGLYIKEVIRCRTEDRWAPLIRFLHLESIDQPFFALKPIRPPSTSCNVLLLRDPRDIVVSHFHHVVTKNSGVVDALGRKRKLPDDYEIGEFIRSDFLGIRHILHYAERWSRWAAKNGAPIFYYEDFVGATKATLRDFLLAVGVSGIEPPLIRKSIDDAAFDRMAEAELRLHEKLGVKGTKPSRRRMRKGKVGGFVEEVSKDDAVYMTRVMTRAAIPALKRYLPT